MRQKSYKAKLWKIKQRTNGGLWEQRIESKIKVYEVYIKNEIANWLCGALPTPHLEVWVDERDDQGWRLYERVNLEVLANAERARDEADA